MGVKETMQFPMPNDSAFDGIVIASAWIDDERAGVLVLNPTAPYYKVIEVNLVSHQVRLLEMFPNIVPATKYYNNDVTGCW